MRNNQSKCLLRKSRNRLDKIEMIFSMVGFSVFFGILLSVIIYCCV